MYIHFHLHYRTVFGEQIGIQYSKNEGIHPEEYLFQTLDGENWTGKLPIDQKFILNYNYVLFSGGNTSIAEWGHPRQLNITSDTNIFVEDKWRQRANENNAFLTTAFTKSVFKRPEHGVQNGKKNKIISLLKNKKEVDDVKNNFANSDAVQSQ